MARSDRGLEFSLIRAYLNTLAEIIASDMHTFKSEARQFQFRLTDPKVNINQELFDLDNNPESPFESFLKTTAHRKVSK